MEKFIRTNLVFYFLFFIILNIGYGQNFSELEIKNLAIELNKSMINTVFDNGIIGRKCFSTGRTIVYTYDIPADWEFYDDLKQEVISNLKNEGDASFFSKYNIDVEYQYYKNNLLFENVTIKSSELIDEKTELDGYIDLNGHPKAKGVNLKLRTPKSWEVREGNRPNIVKKFVNGTNVFLILIKNNITFLSRRQSRDNLEDKTLFDEIIKDTFSFLEKYEIIKSSLVNIDTYNGFQVKVRGSMKKSEMRLQTIMIYWFLYYEDKIIVLQAMGFDEKEFKSFETTYQLIANSLIFPEQYK
jgi:hypothetical protein